MIILFQKFLWYKTLAAPIFAPGFSIEFNIVSAITGRLEMFLAIHQRLDVVQGFAEALEVDYFPLSQKPQSVLDAGVVRELDQMLVGGPGFLFGGHVLAQVGDRSLA